jgi:hypothetical protein
MMSIFRRVYGYGMRVWFLVATWIRGARTQGELRQFLELIRRVRVVSGPFSGMRYVPHSCGSAWSPKILGTYELEIANLFRRSYLSAFDQVIDIGCAEGYYLAGLGFALRRRFGGASSRVSLVGFDTDPRSIATARQLMDLNRLEADLHLRCFEHADMPEGRHLYIVDIEGDELQLLDAAFFARAVTSDVVVEVHDQPGCRRVLQAILDASAHTHSAGIFHRTDRRWDQFPKRFWPPIRKTQAM